MQAHTTHTQAQTHTHTHTYTHLLAGGEKDDNLGAQVAAQEGEEHVHLVGQRAKGESLHELLGGDVGALLVHADVLGVLRGRRSVLKWKKPFQKMVTLLKVKWKNNARSRSIRKQIISQVAK